MAEDTRHIGVWIDRPADAVYAYAGDPANLPAWASGLGAAVEQVGGEWVADSPMGRVAIAFAARNVLGVLDHDVRLPSGETVTNPMRVMPDAQGCDVVFTLRRPDGADDEAFAADADTIAADLAALKRVLEQG